MTCRRCRPPPPSGAACSRPQDLPGLRIRIRGPSDDGGTPDLPSPPRIALNCARSPRRPPFALRSLALPPPDRSAAAAQHTKAAEPTVKRVVPAQHNPALKALVPASVRIQRERQMVPAFETPQAATHSPTTTAATAAPKPRTPETMRRISSFSTTIEIWGRGAFGDKRGIGAGYGVRFRDGFAVDSKRGRRVATPRPHSSSSIVRW